MSSRIRVASFAVAASRMTLLGMALIASLGCWIAPAVSATGADASNGSARPKADTTGTNSQTSSTESEADSTRADQSNSRSAPATASHSGKSVHQQNHSDDAGNQEIMFRSQPESSMQSGATATAGPAAAKSQGSSKADNLRRKSRSLAPCTAWVDSDVEPKAVLLCVHGLGLHNATYQAFGERMAKLGIATYAVDVRGFGSWQQANGRQDVDFEDCLTDVADTLRFIHKANPGLPVFILGESMGGAIALRITSLYPDLVDGLISCVPSGDRFKQHKGELSVALHFLAGGNKKFDVGSGVIEQASSSSGNSDVNEELRSAWANDPLAKLKLSPRELIQFQHFMNENDEAAKKIFGRPVLMVQGWEDNLVKWTGTLELWNELPTDDKQIELIPNAKHLIFEESQFNDKALNERVDKMVTRWIDDHTRKPSTK